MSDKLSEFVHSWNESMMDQIRESDIKNPAESQCRRWIVCVLKKLLVDTSSYENMDHDTGTQLKMKRLRLVAIVNHFLKIASPNSKAFAFMDLIQPKSRKVVATLNLLLNYSFFVDLKYKETILDLKDKLNEVDALKSEKHELRKHLEEVKIREENNVKEIRSLDAKFPRQTAKVLDMEANEKALKTEAARIEAEIEKFETDFSEIKNEVENLKTLVVPDQEIESVLASEGSIAKQLEEQDQITIAGRQKLEQNSQSIEQALASTNKMEALFASIDIDADKMIYKKEQLDKIKAEVNALQSNIVKIRMNIETYTHSLQLKNGSVKQVVEKLNAVKNAANSQDTEQQKELKELENLVHKLLSHEAALAHTNQRLKDEQALLFKLATNVIKHISTKNFEE